jgi:methionine synthase II (cobalamin-independent)
VDFSVLSAADHDVLGEALDAGDGVALGMVPSVDPAVPPTDGSLTDRVLTWLDQLGLDPEAVSSRLLVTPACGLAGASPDWARRALALSREVAKNL